MPKTKTIYLLNHYNYSNYTENESPIICASDPKLLIDYYNKTMDIKTPLAKNIEDRGDFGLRGLDHLYIIEITMISDPGVGEGPSLTPDKLEEP